MCSIARMSKAASVISLFAVILSAESGLGQELDLRAMFHESIPPSPFMNVVYQYADAMLRQGRDNHGPRHTSLFLDILDR